MPRITLLTARLLARTLNPRGEGDPPENDPPKKTRQEWESERESELATKTQLELARKVAGLEFDVQELRGKVPKKNQRVLTPEEAADFDAFSALGKPAEVKTRLESGEQASTSLKARERGDMLRDVAEATGTNLKALTRLAGELGFEVGEETEVEGKKVRPVTVKDGDKSKPFADYLKDEWADVAPALLPTTLPDTKPPVTFPRQDSSGPDNSSKSWVQQTLSAQKDAGSYVDPLQAPAKAP